MLVVGEAYVDGMNRVQLGNTMIQCVQWQV